MAILNENKNTIANTGYSSPLGSFPSEKPRTREWPVFIY
jgi:hypothetical protein